MWLCVLVLLSTPSISLFHPSPHLLKCCEEASQEFTSGSLKVRGFKRLPPLRGSWSWSHNISSGCSQLLILAHRGEKVKQTREATINVCVCVMHLNYSEIYLFGWCWQAEKHKGHQGNRWPGEQCSDVWSEFLLICGQHPLFVGATNNCRRYCF